MAKLETLTITKEGYVFIRNRGRKKLLLQPLTDEQIEKAWKSLAYKNQGANPKDYPISENEIRITKDTFSANIDYIKYVLEKNGYTYRQDGYIQEAMYI